MGKLFGKFKIKLFSQGVIEKHFPWQGKSTKSLVTSLPTTSGRVQLELWHYSAFTNVFFLNLFYFHYARMVRPDSGEVVWILDAAAAAKL
jgi:hypothetical protein